MFCIKCGKEIKEGAKFCVYCGETVHALTEETMPASTEKEEEELSKQEMHELEDVLEPIQTTMVKVDTHSGGKRKMWIALSALCVVLVAGVIVAGVLISQSSSQEAEKSENDVKVVKTDKKQGEGTKQDVEELVKVIEAMDISYATAFDMGKLTEFKELVQADIQKGDYENALDTAKQWEEYAKALSTEKSGLSASQVAMDATSFPMIYVNIDVEDEEGNTVSNLTADNIVVWEYVNEAEKKKVEDVSLSLDPNGIADYCLAFKTTYRNTEDGVRYHIYMDNAEAGDSITGSEIYEAEVFQNILDEFLAAYIALVNNKDYSYIEDYIYTEESAKEGYGMEKEMKAQTDNENLLSESLQEGIMKELIWVDDTTCQIRSNEIYDAVYVKTTKSIRNDKNSNAWDMLCETYGGDPFEYEDEMEPEDLERIQEMEWEVSATVYQNCLYELKWSEGEGWKFFRFVEGVSQQHDVYKVY